MPSDATDPVSDLRAICRVVFRLNHLFTGNISHEAVRERLCEDREAIVQLSTAVQMVAIVARKYQPIDAAGPGARLHQPGQRRRESPQREYACMYELPPPTITPKNQLVRFAGPFSSLEDALEVEPRAHRDGRPVVVYRHMTHDEVLYVWRQDLRAWERCDAGEEATAGA